MFSAEGGNIKKLLVPFAILLLLSVAGVRSLAQERDAKNLDGSAAATMPKKVVRLTGIVEKEGLALVGDKDKKIFKVVNPVMLRNNQGRHVALKAHMDPSKNEIYVTSVEIVPEHNASIKWDDSAFRR